MKEFTVQAIEAIAQRRADELRADPGSQCFIMDISPEDARAIRERVAEILEQSGQHS